MTRSTLHGEVGHHGHACNDTTHVLPIALDAAVMLTLAIVPTWSERQRRAHILEAVEMITAHGDDLLYGGRHCADTFNALVKGLAVLARCPGGVTAFGRHWCATQHAGCPHRRSQP